MSENIVRAIKMAAGSLANDNVQIFIGMVVDISNAETEGTISVKQLTGKIATLIQPLDSTYALAQKDKPIPDGQTILDESAGEKIFPHVQLQPTPGNYNFVIPKVNSLVRVIYSKYQVPFVIQIAEVEKIYSSVGDNEFLLGGADNKWIVKHNQNSLVVDEEGALASVDNGKSIQLSVNTGAEIDLKTKIKIQNQNENLYTLLKEFIDAVKTGVDTGGYSFNPATVAQLDLIKTRLGQLLE